MPSTLRPSTVYAGHRTLTLLSLLTASVMAHAAPSADQMDLHGMSHRLQKRANTIVGCFSSSGSLTDSGTYTYQSAGYCSTTTCGSSSIFAMTGGDDCWCGDTAPPKSDKVDDSKCNQACTGYPSDTCGGSDYWSVYTTEDLSDVQYDAASSSSSASSSKSPTTDAPSAASSSPSETAVRATLVSSTIAGGSTVVVTQFATHEPLSTSSTSKESGGGGGSNTAGVAAGVVVGVVALAGLIGGLIFFMRRKKQKEAEEEYRQKNQMHDFMRSTSERKPGSGYSGLSDQRLDPTAGARRNSVGSLADNQDYSRRILRVANPDGN